MAATSKKEHIFAAIEALFSTILVSNGYATDVQLVDRQRGMKRQEILPAIFINDVSEEGQTYFPNRRIRSVLVWNAVVALKIDAHDDAEKNTLHTTLNAFIKDVRDAIATDEFLTTYSPMSERLLVMHRWRRTMTDEGFFYPKGMAVITFEATYDYVDGAA